MAVLCPIPTGVKEHDEYKWVRTPDKDYTYGEYRQALVDSGRTTTLSIWDETKDMLVKVDEPPGVRMWCLYGTNVKTVNGVKYKKSGLGIAEEEEPELIYGKGDGTVHHASL